LKGGKERQKSITKPGGIDADFGVLNGQKLVQEPTPGKKKKTVGTNREGETAQNWDQPRVLGGKKKMLEGTPRMVQQNATK